MSSHAREVVLGHNRVAPVNAASLRHRRLGRRRFQEQRDLVQRGRDRGLRERYHRRVDGSAQLPQRISAHGGRAAFAGAHPEPTGAAGDLAAPPGGLTARSAAPSYFFKVVNTTLLMDRFSPIPIASLAINTSYPELMRSLNSSACLARPPEAKIRKSRMRGGRRPSQRRASAGARLSGKTPPGNPPAGRPPRAAAAPEARSGCRRSYVWTVRGSPSSRAICSIRGTIAGSPHRCSSAAGKPSTARVKAYPRGVAEKVRLVDHGDVHRPAHVRHLHRARDVPRPRHHFTLLARDQVAGQASSFGVRVQPSATSHASSRSGEQYTPDSARFNFCTAACVFPELVARRAGGWRAASRARRGTTARARSCPGPWPRAPRETRRSVGTRSDRSNGRRRRRRRRNLFGSPAPRRAAARVPKGEDPPLSSRAAFFFFETPCFVCSLPCGRSRARSLRGHAPHFRLRVVRRDGFLDGIERAQGFLFLPAARDADGHAAVGTHGDAFQLGRRRFLGTRARARARAWRTTRPDLTRSCTRAFPAARSRDRTTKRENPPTTDATKRRASNPPRTRPRGAARDRARPPCARARARRPAAGTTSPRAANRRAPTDCDDEEPLGGRRHEFRRKRGRLRGKRQNVAPSATAPTTEAAKNANVRDRSVYIQLRPSELGWSGASSVSPVRAASPEPPPSTRQDGAAVPGVVVRMLRLFFREDDVSNASFSSGARAGAGETRIEGGDPPP